MASAYITKSFSMPTTKLRSTSFSNTSNKTIVTNQSFSSNQIMGTNKLLSSMQGNRTTISSIFKPPPRTNKSVYSMPTNVINKAYYSKQKQRTNKPFSSQNTYESLYLDPTKTNNNTFNSMPAKTINQTFHLKLSKRTNRNISSKPAKGINKPFGSAHRASQHLKRSSLVRYQNKKIFTAEKHSQNVNVDDSFSDVHSDQEIFQDNKRQQKETTNSANEATHCICLNENIRQPYGMAATESENNCDNKDCNQSFLENNQHTTIFQSLSPLKEKSSDYKDESFPSHSVSGCNLGMAVNNVNLPHKMAKGVFPKFLDIFFALMIFVGILTCVVGVCIVVTGGCHTSFQVGLNGWPNLLSLKLDVNFDNINENGKDSSQKRNCVQNKQQKQGGDMFTNMAKRTRNNVLTESKHSYQKGKITKRQKNEQVTRYVDQAKHLFESKPQSTMTSHTLPGITQEKSQQLQQDESSRNTKESMNKQHRDVYPIIAEHIKEKQVRSGMPKANHIRWPEHVTSLHDSPAVQVAEVLTLRASQVVTDALSQLSLVVWSHLP